MSCYFKSVLLYFLIGAASMLICSAKDGLAQEQGDDLTVHIGRPGEGETLYSGPSTIPYSVNVTGWITGQKANFEEIHIRLEIYQSEQKVLESSTQVQPEGFFDFLVTVNPEAFVLDEGFNDTNFLRCGIACHFTNKMGLPNGNLRLRVVATDSDGSEASAERNIKVDKSNNATVPFKVILDGGIGKNVGAGIPVKGSTRLYMWRSRHIITTTNLNGRGEIQLEALSEVPTHYTLTVEPVVVNQIFYESVEPIDLVLPPGATSFPLVTIRVKAKLGQITGKIIPIKSNQIFSMPIWGIRLPDGSGQIAYSSDHGTFGFEELPITEYLLTTNQLALAEQGYTLAPKVANLTLTPDTTLDLSLSLLDGIYLKGSLYGAEGIPLPFGWVASEKTGQTAKVLPSSGEYFLPDIQKKFQTVIVSAPGYFSQAHLVDLGVSPAYLKLVLVPNPDTKRIPWGGGEIVIPSDSQIIGNGHRYSLDRGWLWGAGGTGQPLILQVQGAQISIPAGKFALENLPGKTPWLYLFDGQAEILWGDEREPIALAKDQMIALLKNVRPVPVPYDPVVVAALQQVNQIPISPSWQPSLQAQIRDHIALAGIIAAQIMTFITYVMVFISIVVAPFVGIYWLRWGRSKVRETKFRSEDDKRH